MPTILSHPAATLLKPWFGNLPPRVVAAGALGTIVPDFDVAGFAFGIRYASTFGHRGFTHSFVFALLFAALATLLLRPPRHAAAFAFLFTCTASHPILDALTNGGLGVAFFSPFSNERYFFPWRPIAVSPIGAGFFSARGTAVLANEVLWVWIPMTLAGALGAIARRRSV